MDKVPQLERVELGKERKGIMERAHFERLRIIYDSLSRIFQEKYDKLPQTLKTSASVAGNFLPPFAELKLFIEGIKGETLGGRKLNNSDRILQVIAAFTSAFSKLLGAYAIAERSENLGAIAGTSFLASWVATVIVSRKEAVDGLKNIISSLKRKQIQKE